MNLYPLPNFTGSSRYNYQVPLIGVGNQSNVNVRVSHTINSKNQVSGNFGWQNGDTTSPNLFGFIDSSSRTGINTGLTWTHHFSAYLISNLRYNFSRSAGQATPYFANTQNISQAAGSRERSVSRPSGDLPACRFQAESQASRTEIFR